jgi:hypothetical protein
VRPPKVLAGVSAVVVAVPVALAGSSAPGVIAEAGATAAAGEPWRGVGVGRARWLEDGRITEEWLDRRTGASRTVREFGPADSEIAVQDGRTAIRWQRRARVANVFELFGSLDSRRLVGSELLTPWLYVRTGRARVVGRGEFTGRPTLVVRHATGADYDAPPAEVVWDVDEETFLPLRGRLVAAGEVRESVTFRYAEVRRRTLSARFFRPSLAWSPRRPATYRAVARSFPFPVYDLGERHAGVPLRMMQAMLWPYTGGRERFRGPELLVDYSRPGGGGVLLIERPAPRPFPRARWRPSGTVTVAGGERTLYWRRGGEVSVVLGRTWVIVQGSVGRAEAIRLFGALRRLS